MRGSLAAMIEPEISPWTEPELRLGFRELADAARREGHEFLFRMETEWREGGLRFDSPGECLFIARLESGLVGLSGICRDPYQPREDIGRLRHVYVMHPFARAVSVAVSCWHASRRPARGSTAFG